VGLHDSSSSSSSSSQTRRAGGSDPQQQQQQQRRRRMLAAAAADGDLPLPPGYRPPLNGVKTHKAWLAKQAAGLASNNTHTGTWCVVRCGA
jgi:hypothetical protein